LTIKILTEQIVALKAIPPISRGEEWEERQKARQREMQAFSKDLAMLSSDQLKQSLIVSFVPNAHARLLFSGRV